MNTIAIERVAASSAPIRLPVDGESSLEERHWVVRLSADVPTNLSAAYLESVVSEAAITAVRGARIARSLDPAAEEGRVQLRLHFVDVQHVIVSIRTVCLERDDAHAWLVAASAALRSLHDLVSIEDIQGFPRHFWKVLIGS